MNRLTQDIRYALRMLLKSPGFAGVAILTLALGIGANTAIFSVINATLLKPLPYPDIARLVFVWQTYGGNGPDNINIVSALNMIDVQKQNSVVESMAWFDSAGKGYNLSVDDVPERVSGVRVTAPFFHVLGVKPLLGRTFLPEEETAGRDREVVLSYPLWQRRFSGDPAIIGKQIPVDGESYTVVGVMPKTFEFQFWSRPRELWVPVGYTNNDLTDRGSNSFVAIARLKPGVSLEQAKADMDTIGHRLAKEYPKDDDDKRFSVTVMPLAEYGMNDLKATLWALFAAVGFVLLIACVNVANLLLARGAGRQRELAIRCALGATRRRLVRQLITESLLMGFLGGVAGIIVALFGLNLVAPLLPANLQYLPFRHVGGIAIDGRVFIFALLLSCLTGVLFGLAPALSTQRNQIIDPLKEGAGRGLTSSGGNRLRHALVAGEVALALIVLAGAALMIDSMSRLLGVDPGLNPKNVLTLDVSTAQENLYVGPPTDEQFCRELTQHLGAIPGVVSVGAVAHLPLSGADAGRGFTIEGRPDPGPEDGAGGSYSVACPNFFRTMGIPLLKGREFTDADRVDSAGVVVMNEAMAKRFWPKGGALGAHIKLFDSGAPWMTVVGIVANFRHDGLDSKPRPHFYRPFTQAGWPFMTVVMRTTTAPASFEQPARRALAQMSGNYPASSVLTMEQIVSDSLGSRRFPMLLLSAFASLALVLSAVGIAGVVGYSVIQRTHEIGIRVALGAQPRDVLKLVLGGSMLWTLGGVVVGIAGAIGLTRLLGNLLYGVQPTDPVILGATAVLLIAVAFAACYFPARRAMRVDPMVALRYE
ncbi:MAG TPA: ABC transporter permease [Candidatus Acidoferrales bacterium]|nr:ABC transporter permease [Candidatus Acidoferrales bacterium]